MSGIYSYNTVFIKSRKNILGFKCIIGCYSPKWLPVNFYTAFAENEGELGWNYCAGSKSDDFKNIPKENSHMGDKWLPRPENNEIFPMDKKIYAVSFLESKGGKAILKVNADMDFKFFVDGKYAFRGLGNIEEELNISDGLHAVSVEFEKAPSIFDIFTEDSRLFLPDYIKGVRGNLLFIETDDKRARKGFDEFLLYGHSEEKEYFKCSKNSYIRPVLERPVFGKSNYPIGVALYGLLRAGRYLGDKVIVDYAHSHLLRCCLIDNYAQWDCKKFGSACVNHQLLHLSSLDDCGSFMSAVLEDYLHFNKDDRILGMVDQVGDYIRFQQERLASGAFFREMKGEYFQYTV